MIQKASGPHADRPPHPTPPAPRAVDPVCGMVVDPATAKHRFAYRGHEFVFCSAGCRTKFEADPEHYLALKPAKAAPFRDAAAHAGCGCDHGTSAASESVARAIDPVCGMVVDPATAKHRFACHGHEFVFCSAGCRSKFEADPEHYLA